MSIRVLHIFSPDIKTRFGGPVFLWRYNFAHWNNPDIDHIVLDIKNKQIIDSQKAFNFHYSDSQTGTSRWGRAYWILSLFKYLIMFRKKYDILHVHILWWGGLLIGPWAKLNNIPAIYDSVLLYADTPSGIIKEKFGKLKLRCLKSYKAIIAISDYIAEDYLQFGFLPESVFRLLSSVDTNLFSPLETSQQRIDLRRKNNISRDSKILYFVGSVIARKGIDVLIDALILVSKILPNLEIVIVGAANIHENPSIDEEYIKNLKTKISQSGLTDQVHFMGLVQDRQKLAELYKIADVFVFPSRNEGLPNVVLEAMSSGLPIVVSDLPVLKNIVIHRETGLVVPTNNAEALGDTILALLNNPDLSNSIGKAAREQIVKNHSYIYWQLYISEIYKKIMD